MALFTNILVLIIIKLNYQKMTTSNNTTSILTTITNMTTITTTTTTNTGNMRTNNSAYAT